MFCLYVVVFSSKHYDSERDDTFHLRTGNGRNGPNFSTFSFEGEPLAKLGVTPPAILDLISQIVVNHLGLSPSLRQVLHESLLHTPACILVSGEKPDVCINLCYATEMEGFQKSWLCILISCYNRQTAVQLKLYSRRAQVASCLSPLEFCKDFLFPPSDYQGLLLFGLKIFKQFAKGRLEAAFFAGPKIGPDWLRIPGTITGSV